MGLLQGWRRPPPPPHRRLLRHFATLSQRIPSAVLATVRINADYSLHSSQELYYGAHQCSLTLTLLPQVTALLQACNRRKVEDKICTHAVCYVVKVVERGTVDSR